MKPNLDIQTKHLLKVLSRGTNVKVCGVVTGMAVGTRYSGARRSPHNG